MGSMGWSDAFYREAELRETSRLEVERAQRRWQETATPPSSRDQNAAEPVNPPGTPMKIRLSRYKRPWVI